MSLPAYLIDPRQQQPGNRQYDADLQQIKIRMSKLEKRMMEIEHSSSPNDVQAYINPDAVAVAKALESAPKRGPGRPRKEVSRETPAPDAA